MIDERIKFFYKAKIFYKGTQYSGWQIQTEKVDTIQGRINDALIKLTKGLPVQVIGSGRTDAGVHSVGQIARLGICIEIPSIGLLKGLNSVLPKDIQITEISPVTMDFHPQFGAEWKTYIYLFSFKPNNVFNYEYITEIYENIDIDKFKKALDIFIGVHEFKRYQCVGTPIKNTVREIYNIELFQGIPKDLCIPQNDDAFGVKITGSGFLKQMVRLIIGTCFEYGKGKLSLAEIEDSLKLKSDTSLNQLKHLHLAAVAPPQGLYLFEVGYSPYAR